MATRTKLSDYRTDTQRDESADYSSRQGRAIGGVAMSAYIVEHEGRQFTPHGSVNVPDVRSHNRAVEAAELVAWDAGPARFVGYLKRPTSRDGYPIITTWLGTRLADVVTARVGKRWNPFGGRWETVVRGHAHDGDRCYTFSGDYECLTRLRRVKPCRARQAR